VANLKSKQSGTLITPEIVAALAVEAERGYDLSQAARRESGRPSLAEGEGSSPRVSFRTTRALYEAARKRAAAEGRSVSALARDAIARYVQD
jgi:hypothetical protein